MSMPIRRMPLLQPSLLLARTPHSNISASLNYQQRHLVSKGSKSDSSAPLAKDSGIKPSARFYEAAETLKKLKEELALLPPKYPKEYHEISTSLSNCTLQSEAPWGFVVVRTVYGMSSDAAWAQILELLQSSVAETLALHVQSDLLSRYTLSTIEDEATLAGADSYAVRRAFRAWVAEDLPPRLGEKELKEFGGTAQVHTKLLSNDAHHALHTNHPVVHVPPRWQFCVFVDEDCVRSLNAPSGSANLDPALKILTTDWVQDRPSAPTEAFTFDWDGGETDNDSEDVGWMYMDMSDYVPVYARLVTPFLWHEYHQRPYKGYVDQ